MEVMSKKNSMGWDNDQDPLQAIIIADSFDEKFAPITYECPRALLPVLNKPMIDYTLEMLFKTEVKEILVVTKAHSNMIREHLMKFWCNRDKGVVIHIIPVNGTACLTIGDALREIDRDHRAILRGEFILIYGFVISGGDLKHLLKAHQLRKIHNSNIIMTSIFNNFTANHVGKSDSEIFVVTNSETNEILNLQYRHEKYYTIPLSIMNSNKSVRVYHNLSDAGIYFMDLTALQLFSENFDYQTIDDFVRNVIGDELLQKSICYDVVTDEYFGTIRNLKLYHSISFDILRRWTYPTVPDLDGYTFHPNNIYLGKNVDIDRTADIKNLVMIGHNSVICQNTRIDRTIIGQNCKIGNGSRIVNSYIFDNVTIQNNCNISNSIICSNSKVLQYTELKKGSILSYDVTVGPNTILPQLTIVYIPDRCGRYFPSSVTFVDLGSKSVGSLFTIHDCDLDFYQWGSFLPLSKQLKGEEISDGEEEAEARVAELDHLHEFYFDVKDSVQDGMTRKTPVENIITEINISKHTHNISVDEMIKITTDVLTDWLFPTDSIDSDQNKCYIKKRFKVCAPFCRRFFNTDVHLLNCLSHMEEFMFTNQNLSPLYPTFISHIYLNDIANERVLDAWLKYIIQEKESSIYNDILSKRHIVVDAFLQNLKKMAEEGSTSDEDEDDQAESD